MSFSIKNILTLGGMLFLSCVFSNALAARDVEAAQSELQHVTGHLETLKQTLSENQTQQSELQNQLKNAELTLSKLDADLAVLDKTLLVKEAELEKLKKSQENYLQQLARQRNALTDQTRLMYKLGKAQNVKNILNPDDANNISRHIFYYHYLSNARRNVVAEVNQILEILNKNVSTMAAEEINLKNLRQQKQFQQHQAQLAQTKRQQIIAELNSSNTDKQHQIETLMANQSGLQKMLASLRSRLTSENLQTFNQSRGKLEWPIESRTATMNTHQMRQGGVIIKAPEGTPVHAIYGGKIIFADWLRGFGLLIIINHGDGFMSLYARNHAIFAKVGDMVNPRDVIASIGNTGGYSTSSLYFEIRQNGLPVNPKLWCV
jgi:septal ring factor EnvC (AmiA/AmiB activator)